jgi:CcmD family protein
LNGSILENPFSASPSEISQGVSMNYLFAAYTLIWIVLFGYVLRLSRRQQALKVEIDQMQQQLAGQKKY